MECAPSLLREWLTVPVHPNLVFRVAVREVESWLIADRSGLARFLGIQVDLIPQDFDETSDPKRTLLNLAKMSRDRDLRRDVVPKEGSTSQQGPNYNARMSHFVEKCWDPNVAAQHSASLARTLEALRRFIPANSTAR
jgi:hypothetical protein